MFTFPESEYKWCPQCGGNIRREAYYCRYCKAAIENKFLKKGLASPACVVSDVALWLPKFNTLVTRCSPELQERLRQADEDHPPGTVGVPVGTNPHEYRRQQREADFCPPEPPDPHVAGLLFDILMSIYERGESLADICDYSHLQLIELTPQEVAAECELRREEMTKNHPCEYCAEYKFPEDEECRFCGGSPGTRPRARDKFFDKEIDRFLLKDVLLYEAAWSTICGTTPIVNEILETNGITQDTIGHEILRQRSPGAAPPMGRFCKRMYDLKLTSYTSPEGLAIARLIELGNALDSKKVNRADEALIVYNHALKRTDDREDLMHSRGQVLTYLAMYYQGKEDFEKYRKYNQMAVECNTYGMPDDMKEMMRNSDAQRLSMFDDVDVGDDPEARLEALNKKFGLKNEAMDKLAEQIDATVPGLGALMATFTARLDDQMGAARISLEAQIAEKNGDYALAETKLLEALKMPEDTWMGGGTRCSMLCSLAHIKHLQGDDQSAEAHLKEAMQNADEYLEAKPDFGKHMVWSTRASYANFLRDVGRYDESEEFFKSAFQVQEENISEMLAQYGGDKGTYCGSLASVKKDYAKLLLLQGRGDEASAVEAEADDLQRAADAAEAKAKERRLKFKKGMLGDSP